VQVHGDELTISGQRGDTRGDQATFHRRERGSGRFRRSIGLPIPIDAERVEATLKDGVLTLTLPKSQSAKPRKIDVRQV
jgi:HSP20 family protein